MMIKKESTHEYEKRMRRGIDNEINIGDQITHLCASSHFKQYHRQLHLFSFTFRNKKKYIFLLFSSFLYYLHITATWYRYKVMKIVYIVIIFVFTIPFASFMCCSYISFFHSAPYIHTAVFTSIKSAESSERTSERVSYTTKKKKTSF
jgi:hypothetical protein